jgi:hypothetical protein
VPGDQFLIAILDLDGTDGGGIRGLSVALL